MIRTKKFILYFTCFSICFCLGWAIRQYHLPYRLYQLWHTPKISIVMSTYNRAKTMHPAIISILEQTEPDFEFIIINDGSNDDTDKILKSFAKKDPRIRILTNEQNKGLIYSLNRGLDAAKGTYIARMDDDDFSLPFRFERQLAAMEAYPSVTLFGSYITDDKKTVKKQTGIPKTDNPKALQIYTYTSSGLAHPTIFIRRQFLEQHHIRYKSDNLHAEDCGLYADILDNGGILSTVKEPLLRYGFKKNLKKPDNYHHTQYNTFKKIQREKLSRLFEPDEKLLGAFQSLYNRCLLWRQMVSANKTKQIVDQETLEEIYQNHCPSNFEQAVVFQHEWWEDFIMFEKNNRIRRHRANDTATIMHQTPNEISVKWDKYGTETFKKTKPHTFRFVAPK